MASDTLDVLRDLMGYAPPVDFHEFVSSKDYCNNPDLYQFWYNQKEALPEHCNELILDGSIGGGKSTFAAYYLAYRIYLLFQSGSPQLQLGIPYNSDIFCLYFSVSLSMAQKSGFNLLYSIFADCKWFKDNCPIDTMKKSSIVFIDRHFQIDFASNFGHQIGLNVFAFILDEANFRSGVGLGVAEEYAEATELYQQLLDRQISRFARPDGSVDALAILVSSASYQSSFSEQRAQAIKSNPNAKRITVRKYEVTPERFSPEKFTVFIGSGSSEPCIITSDEHKKKILQHAGLDGTGQEDSYFLDVPVNLKPQFDANIVLALQNHCGVATNMSSSFMPNLRFLYESYVDDILPVFESENVEASTDNDTQIKEYLLPGNFQYTNRPHSLFLDLSVQSDVGALCCYRYDGKDDKGYDIHTRVFSLHIVPPPYPASTRIEKVKQFIIDLSSYINIVAFASDQYQSTQLRQDIQATLGLPDTRISIDSSDQPHILWARALVDGRIRQPKDEYLEREVREAVHDHKRHRVLKASKSSDDVLQANIGAFFLSDTIGKQNGSIDDLYDSGHKNITSTRAFQKMLKDLGYTSSQ